MSSPVEQTEKTGLFAHFKSDFMASLVVFLVALPLCIGIAVAVGVSPARALITGIIGGLIVGFFAGSPLQVSGPAAGLFVIIADMLLRAKDSYLAAHPEIEAAEQAAAAEGYALTVLGCAVFLAGAMQIAAGRLKLGQWFRAVSPAVIKGMLAGIGVLILVSQFHLMLDHTAMWGDVKARGGLQYIATIPEAVFKCFASNAPENHHISEKHHLAAITGLLTIACFVLWPKLAPARLKFLPGALIGILLATIFAAVTQVDVKLLKVPDNMFSETTFPTTEWFTMATHSMVLVGAVVIALVASAETLLCATAVDQMHGGPRTKYDQELTAQGVGNMLCGLVGALPMTGVIVRSSANVNSGAKTRASTILHGLWLLIFVAAIPFVLTYIPTSALGALLVYTGFKLVSIGDIKKLWAAGRSEAGIYFATLTVIVCKDLLMGVIVGIVLSAIKLLVRFSDLTIHTETSDDKKSSRMMLTGAATFIGLPKLANELEQVPQGAELRVDYSELTYIDHACLDLLMNWAKQHSSLGGQLIMDWEGLHGRFSNRAAANGQVSAAQEVAEPSPEKV